jgi:hypothetical protein
MSRRRWPAIVIGWLGIAICLIGLRLSSAVKAQDSQSQTVSFIAPLARLEPRLVQILFLGKAYPYQAFLSAWIEKKLTSSKLTQEDANQIFADYDVMAHHAPPLEWFYLGPCLVFSERLNRPDLCFSISGYGQSAIPTSWKIPLLQSFIEGARLGRSERSHYFLQIAANKPGSPDQIKQSVAESDGMNLTFENLLRLLGEDGAQRYKFALSMPTSQGNF